MKSLKIKVANRIIEIEYNYDRTYELCCDYLTKDNADFKVQVSQQDLIKEGLAFEKENGMLRPHDRSLEFFAVLRKSAEKMIDYDTFLMHGVAISKNNQSYLFIGKSGIGKTTHTNKWIQNDSETYIVNGDKPFIIADKVPMVSGSPWAGKEGFQTNTVVPLKAIIIMERAEDNQMEKISFSQAFPFLLQQTYRPENEQSFKKTISLLLQLKDNVSFYRFKFNNFKDNTFQVSYTELVSDTLFE